MEQDYSTDMCGEPIMAIATVTDEWEAWNEPEIPYEVDFGP
jgi:hypothetical protein